MKTRLLILAFALVVVSCNKESNNAISGSGVFEGTEVLVSSKSAGEITRLLAKEGDSVAVGDTLAQIDVKKLIVQNEQLEAGLREVDFNIRNAQEAIERAQLNFDNIEKRYNRIKSLFDNGTATQQQMDDIQTQYDAAKTAVSSSKNTLQAVQMKKQQVLAQQKLLKLQISDGTVLSPSKGVIIDKFVEQGEITGPGMPLVSVVDLQELEIKLYVPETQLGFVKLGSQVDIKIDSYPEKTFSGKIVWISPKAEFTPKNVQTKEARADLVYAVKVLAPNPDGILKIGMPADVVLAEK